MTPRRPTRAQLRAARPFLRALAAARQARALYPANHPDVEAALAEAAEAGRELASAGPLDSTLLIVFRSSFYLGPTLLAQESIAHVGLAEALQAAGVESLEVGDALAVDDLEQLLDVVDGRAPLAARLGALGVNDHRAEHVVDTGDQLDLADLRRAYGRGLELLREAGVGLVVRGALDLEASAATVRQLADQVEADPAKALLLTTVKSYDEYTYYHMVNVALLSISLGQAIGLREDQVLTLGLGGLLHDIGKVFLPHDVLTHPGRLDEEQWRLIQRHPVDGASVVFGTGEGLFHPAAPIVLEHHSGFDNQGYPRLATRARPSLPARLVAVADGFDALTTHRPYRAPATRREALEILHAGAGRGLDPRPVRVFQGLLGLFPVGALVELDSGEIAVVLRNHDRLLARPTVLVVLDARGEVVDREERDLSATNRRGDYRWNVTRPLDPDALGIDVLHLVTTGELHPVAHPGEEAPTEGLVHEPAFGEQPPDGYRHHHHHDAADAAVEGREDPDIHPPMPG